MEAYSQLRSSADPLYRLVYQNLRLNALAVVMGLLGGAAAILFRGLLFSLNSLFFHQELSLTFRPPLEHHLGPWVLVVPALGGLVVGWITTRFAPEAKGHGVPEVMAAVAERGGRMRPRVVLAKALASGVCIGSGGSSGREGPIVQIGSAAGSALGQLLRLETRDLKVLVGCGATAGIAATFNTPLAGVLFAIELILLEFRTRSFVPLVISSVFATILSRSFLGRQPAFIVPPYAFQSPMELWFYLILGLIAAGVGVLIIELLYGLEDAFERLKLHPVLKPALGGLMLGALGFFVTPRIFGVGYETVDAILQGAFGDPALPLAGLLLGLGLLKVLALSITLGSGGSGGVFAPSLFIGAAVGGAFGVAVNALFPGVAAPYPAYALVGMAAVFAAASRATLTSIVMLFEMTRDYHIILPLMFACVVATIVAWVLYPETIYTKKLARRGLKIEKDLEVNVLRTRFVADVMTQAARVIAVTPAMTLRQVRNLILETGHQGFPVLDESGKLVGIVTGHDILEALKKDRERARDWPVSAVMKQELVVAYPEETLDLVWERMRLHGIGRLPVVDRRDPSRLLGIVTRGDLIRFRK